MKVTICLTNEDAGRLLASVAAVTASMMVEPKERDIKEFPKMLRLYANIADAINSAKSEDKTE